MTGAKLKAAEFIVNAYGSDVTTESNIDNEVETIINSIKQLDGRLAGLSPASAIAQIQERMTAFGGHIRRIINVKKAITDAINLS